MSYTLTPLPYGKATLEPAISQQTIEVHYGKHHQGYVDKLNALLGDEAGAEPLEDVILGSFGKEDRAKIFNNAAQVWNHDFFWASMVPGGGVGSLGTFASALERSFGAYETFEERFVEQAKDHFGSGYVWLVQEGEALRIHTTHDAITPIALGQAPLLTCDLWEHAYYLDYQNDRETFVRSFLRKLAHWRNAEALYGATNGHGHQPPNGE